MAMAPAEWEQVLELFHAAVDTTPEERRMVLDQACGAGTAIREAVEGLLREHDSAGSFLSRPVWDSVQAGLSAEPFSPGSRFASFVLEEVLGRGGMGEVWSARDFELDRTVALKFLRSHATSQTYTAWIVRESQAASALNHPNIVSIHGVVRSAGIAAIVMELVEGSSLATLGEAPATPEKVLAIGSQIARALAAAHEHGIVHGDIKPENIVLRPDGYVKVLDFGLAHRVIAAGSSAAQAPALGGTMRYMSPEQARRESLTPASDIFSFGLVLFELAAGRHPFADQAPAEALYSNLTRTPPAPSSVNPRVPPGLNSLILAMLTKDPAQRPSAAQVAERIDAAARVRAGRGRRFWLPVALGACLSVAALGGWFLSRISGPPQFADLRIEPLTSQDGWEAAPAFSPDGRSVAFTWAESLETQPQIYVKRDNDSAPVKLTDVRAEGMIASPAWSPDGEWIAFKRDFKSTAAIFAIRAAGGGEKKLVDLRVVGSSTVVDWSPDGRQRAFSDRVSNSGRLAIHVLDLQTGKERQLTSPASVEFADWDPRFSPDGRTIAFKRVGGFWDDAIYIVPVAGGEAKRMISQGGGIWGHAWSRDSRSLIVSCQHGGSIFGLWRFPLDGRSPPERIIQGAPDAITPAVSAKTGRLTWIKQNEDVNIYRVAASGGEPPARLIASTARDRDAEYAPDGRIAFISDRSGTREIWLAGADGSDQHRVTNFGGPDLDNLTWSPDGRQLAFYARTHGRSEIFTIECDPPNRNCGAPKSTISGMKAEAPAWSRDGRFLYFASDRTGRWEVWRAPAFGGQPSQITRHGGFLARESPDGNWLYFFNSGKLWRMRFPVDPSGDYPEEMVVGPPFNVQHAAWTLAPDEVIFMDGANKGQAGSLRAYRIPTDSTRLILPLLRSFADDRDYSVGLSSDSKWILYSQLDRSGSNVMVAESH